MSKPISLYFLYCTNRPCEVSIYRRMKEVRIPFTIANLTAAHCCSYCGQGLVSAVNIEITTIPKAASYRNADKTHFFNN